MAFNLADAVKKKVSEIERPPLPPQGTYQWKITKLADMSTSNDEKWDFLTIPCRVVAPLEDVELEDYKGDPRQIVNSVKFVFDKNDEVAFERTLYDAKRFFLEHCRAGDESMTLGQLINASVGAEFIAPIIWRADKNDQTLFHANIGKTAPLD